MGKYKDRYRTNSTRLPNYDYRQNGIYYITICTKDRIHYFGEIESSALQPTEIGKIAEMFWKQIPQHFPFIILDHFVIMPNHIHGILSINNPTVETQDFASLQNENYKNKFAPQSKNLASVIRGYKAGVKTWTVKNNIDFFWQSRFYERIIRDEKELFAVRNYIEKNPEK